MSNGSFETVFDLSQTEFAAWPFLIPGVILTGLGAVMLLFPDVFAQSSWGSMRTGWRRGFAWFYFLFSLTWLVLASTGTFGEDARLRDAMKKGQYQVVEGTVESFDPMPSTGHKAESFDVAGQHFEYSDYVVTSGFHNAASLGGPIRPGLYVRITHVNGTIIKLEIRR